MPPFEQSLPIDEALPKLIASLRARNVAVLVAPPGAGKTTRVPLVLAEEPWAKDRKILVLEPRRLAARAAAERMASAISEQVGDTVGLRVRFGSKVSRRTRIEIVTEGVFTRMVLDDPALEGVAAVLFDEFHERSLDADLGLALVRDVQDGLRDDLRLLVMSATLDGGRIAGLLGSAPLIESQGRAFPVETRYLGRDPRTPVERQMADAIAGALRTEAGSVLAFLPGAAEIRRTETMLGESLSDPTIDVVTLYGALDSDTQDRAIASTPVGRRKVVLATSIAETSLTIEGVRIVLDSGLARVPRYEPDVGLTRLETVRVSRAAADQRRGRAGRTEPGVCLRLWDEPQTASLESYTKPEILAADLTAFALDLAAWGVADPAGLTFLDPPPQAALTEAHALLQELGALDADRRITDEGRQLRRLPLPPRLARMVVDAAQQGSAMPAAEIAVVLTERGLGGNDVDLRHRLDVFRRDRSRRSDEARRMAKRWAELSSEQVSADSSGLSPGAILALAYPDRVAKSRSGGSGAFLLANGRGGTIDPASGLAREPFLAVAELTGAAAHSRIGLAAALTLAEIETLFPDRSKESDELAFEPQSASLRARRMRRFGSIVLAEQPIKIEQHERAAQVLAEGIVRLGLDRLPWTKALLQWRDRVMFLRDAEGKEWPDLSDSALTANVTDWLAPALEGKSALSQLPEDEMSSALMSLLPWQLRRRLDEEAPTHFEAPTGSHVPIIYDAETGPKVSIRVQELFGLGRHPSIAGGRIPLLIELLSPAHRPVQLTRDLPGFWRGSYQAVRTDLRGRYPRHPWPDDPLNAPATKRAKPRGT
ncbi:MAG TPA: ATP-dependent helicase HrpB [Xanthobacteraceae bacterium]|jgi:ATP-dependent helicase HrpB|nr:ATP-dependent helicase HrpB [Xanthobacteraceae bacterium]